MSTDSDIVKAALRHAGIGGVEHFGRFVSNTDFFAPSRFDERAAMPVLLDLLPGLTESNIVSAVAGHLRRPWARPAAFEAVHDAFRQWAPHGPGDAGWSLGDTLGTVSTAAHVDQMLTLVSDRANGHARQMIVYALWRFRRSHDMTPVLIELLDDGDMSLHAMSALQRVIGKEGMRPHLQHVVEHAPGTPRAKIAAKKLRKLSNP